MLERMSIPGFRFGRRFKSVTALRYLNLYEVDDMDVLVGKHYIERLNNPTPLTRRTQPDSKNLSRADCYIELSLGLAQGGAMSTIDLTPLPDRETELRRYLLDSALPAASGARGIVGVHLCIPDAKASHADVEERRGRNVQVPDWVVLIEGVSAAAVEAACDAPLAPAFLVAQGAADTVKRELWIHETTLGALSAAGSQSK
jgi:hypothetical protein